MKKTLTILIVICSLFGCNDKFQFESHSELSKHELILNDLERSKSATDKKFDLIEMQFNVKHYANMYILTEQDKYRIMVSDLIKKHIPKLKKEIKQLEEEL